MLKKKTKIVIAVVSAFIVFITVSEIVLFNIYSPDIHLLIYNNSVDDITPYLTEENSEVKMQLYQKNGLEDDILINEFSFASFNIDCNIENGYEDNFIYILNRNYIIVSFKSQGLHTNRAKYHKEDILVYLDYEEESATIVYESPKSQRIILGNSEQVIVYDFEGRFYQLIDLNTFSVIKQLKSKGLNTDTGFEIYPEENYFYLSCCLLPGPIANDITVEKISFELEEFEELDRGRFW